ncbi:sodium:calcium antiporter [Candidatus Nomurabacteria bacterium]|uniref:Sodium:calcium antiporter n=1 Tax=candidate division WWE3 bacterium TaxID=2053526 RepID=A0A955E0S9_UNCKA|nr:sodium:calcium antiporter [candidate division WWE3 bacterium]MCB9823578.1 sodium:calcium antiporter [Candidatus Nomurabacteria bacterium]MCB9827373.1 sodium:calcium antiporter [Candidatus Nomurabacteria bacterium]HXK52673.1 sodium:calcium antiporter [bacterium]
MDLFFFLSLVLGASVMLIKSVSWFTESSAKIAHHLKISEYTISFFLIAIGTSLPEAFVAIRSGLAQDSILSFGTSMGSNIALVTLVIALPVLLTGSISTRYIIASRDMYIASFLALLPFILSLDGVIGRYDAITLFAGYLLYSIAILKRARGVESLIDKIEEINLLKEAFLFIFSLALLLAASNIIVISAINISETLNISLGFVGLTITALGTSLPEISFTIAAVKKGQTEEIMGDIIGSVVANSTLVLGLAAIFYPIKIDGINMGAITTFFVVLSFLMFMRLARTQQKVTKKEAIVLLGIYTTFIFSELIIRL